MTLSGSGFETVESMARATYEIRVAGTVPERDLLDLGAVTIGVDQVNTVLYGLPDQAALYGLLARLRALGIEVVEVRRIPESPSDTTETTDTEPGHRDDDTS